MSILAKDANIKTIKIGNNQMDFLGEKRIYLRLIITYNKRTFLT